MYFNTLPKGIHGVTMALVGLGKVVKSTPRNGTIFWS
jgi:hypothetical protein